MNDPRQPGSSHAAGWYQVDDHHERYWDGARWSDEVRTRGAVSDPGLAPASASPSAEPEQSREQSAPANTKRPWYKRGWVMAVAALVLGLIIGAAGAGSADPMDSPEYQALSQDLQDTREQLQSTEDDLQSTEDELETARGEVSSTEADLEELTGDLPAREKAVEKAQAALDKRADALDMAEADVRKAAKAVAKREQAVGNVETEIAENTIPGEGVFQVGVDMKSGSYKTTGSADCYYAVLGDPNGNNIKSNNITSGPATVTVSESEYFETSGCADWVLQQ